MVTELLSSSVETETEIVDHDVIIEQIAQGHCTKYDSYGVINLSSNIVIHLELVHVSTYIRTYMHTYIHITTLCYKSCNRVIW